jgi:hypothetical protein
MDNAGASDQAFANWIGTILGGILERSREFENAVVVLTGEVPYRSADLAKFFLSSTRVHINDMPGGLVPDLVVIGQHDFGNGLLDRTMAAANARTRFLPQEGFVDLILFGFDWWTGTLVSYLDHACSYYPGLAYIRENASVGDFEWPTVEATAVVAPRGTDSKQRAEQTELNKLGYGVAMDGPSREERWRLLTRIIDGREITLRDVVGTIASLCRARRRQFDGERKFARALNEWEYDLGRLKAAYYDRGHYQWSWPSVRP